MLGFYMSSHPLTRHAGLSQALATHRVADLAGVPEKSEVVLGGMITGVQIKNVQKSRSGLTRMAKLTFEDLTGSVPAMLWPEEFAKIEDLVKNDADRLRPGDARPPPRPGRADHLQDHPARARPRRAVPRGGRHAPQGGHAGRTMERLLRQFRVASGQPRRLPRDPRPGRRPARHLQGRRLAEDPPRRPASSPTSRRPSAPATSASSATAARPPASRPTARARPLAPPRSPMSRPSRTSFDLRGNPGRDVEPRKKRTSGSSSGRISAWETQGWRQAQAGQPD